jgi:phosphocarrier protein
MEAAMADTASVRVKIVNRLGLHARPAMEFVDLAAAQGCAVKVNRTDTPGEAVDGTSIMQMMMLAATKDTELDIHCSGDNAQGACEALAELVRNGFGEK